MPQRPIFNQQNSPTANPESYPPLPSWGNNLLTIAQDGSASWEQIYWQHIRQSIYEGLGIYRGESAPLNPGDATYPYDGFLWLETLQGIPQNWWRYANDRWESLQQFQRHLEWPNTTGINIRFQIAENYDILIERMVATCYVTALAGTNTYWENNLQPLLANEINTGSLTMLSTNTNNQQTSSWVRRETAGNGQATSQKLFNLNVRKNNNSGTVGNLFGTGTVFYRLIRY